MLSDIESLQGSPGLGGGLLVLAEDRAETHLPLKVPQLSAPVTQLALKRMVDLVASAVLLALLFPMLLAIAVLIRVVDRMPVFYGQQRYGLGGRPFTILKFRTMRCEEPGHAFVQVTPGDARVTRLGAFLRRASLDELPQLINVLVGHMSLVGPRPHAVSMEVHSFSVYPRAAKRLQMRPGMTGLAQIRGLRGPTTTFGQLRARLDADIDYVEGWTFGRDVAIIWATPAAWLLGKNAV